MSDAASALKACWSEAAQGDLAARRSAHQSLSELLAGLQAADDGTGGGSRSLVEVLLALRTLLEDPQTVLPASLSMALTLTQDRLGDLRLRQLLAAEDPQWSRTLLQTTPMGSRDETPQVGSLNAAVDEDTLSDTAVRGQSPALMELSGGSMASSHPGRDWWSIPLEGLSGANQLFMVETRELLRGAELAVNALRGQAADYAEQMVLCRAFQAVAVSARSMGLQRVAEIAAQGEHDIDRLLDQGGAADASTLARVEGVLQALYVQVMELMGEVVVPPEEPHTDALQAQEAPEEAAQESSAEIPPEAAVVASAPLPPSTPPWWWAVDWSSWPDSAPPRVSAVETVAAVDMAEGTTLRVQASVLKAWSERLSRWLPEGSARPSEAEVAGGAGGGDWRAAVSELVAELDAAGLVPVESWSVSLFRTARRRARESGVELDFDLEARGVTLDAAALDRVMPLFESELAGRVPTAAGAALRVVAQAEGHAVRLQLVDGYPHTPDPLGPAGSLGDAAFAGWVAQQGGALQAGVLPGTPSLVLPRCSTMMPLLSACGGAREVLVPGLWVRQVLNRSAAELEADLMAGGIHLEGRLWPLLRLSALIRSEAASLADARVLLIEHADERLALQVDSEPSPRLGRPLAWPAELVDLPRRCGLWGAVGLEDGSLAVVTDPLQLQRRFGAAARVLSRPRRSPAR